MITVIPLPFGTQLAALSEARGLSEAQLAAASGLPPDCITGLICNQQVLTADVASALGAVLNLSPLFLLELQSCFYLRARDQQQTAVLGTTKNVYKVTS